MKRERDEELCMDFIISYDCDFSNQTPLLINLFTKKIFSKTVFYVENNVNPGKNMEKELKTEGRNEPIPVITGLVNWWLRARRKSLSRMFSETRRKATQMLTGIFLVVIMLSSFTSASALETETISRRDLVIDLGEGLTTDAQLTFPAVGDGPFPGVLLVPGSGPCNMDEHIPEGTATGESVRPFLQIAEYLSERGYAVLRYNKRGVDLNYTDIDMETMLNWTYPILKSDAEKALAALMEQDEVDPDDIAIIGHSEGSFVTSLVTAENLDVEKIVLMGAARHPQELAYWQLVELKMIYAEDVLDGDDDGLITIQDVVATIGSDTFVTIPAQNIIENSTGEWRWYPAIDQDGDGYFNITGELWPLLLQSHEYLTTAEYPGSILFQSSDSVDSMTDTLPGASSSILILHGGDDILAPPEEAHLLEQALTGAGHPDHTLITYPGLSHYYYPSDGYSMAIGPIQENVLSDIAAWLNDPARKVRNLDSQLQTAEYIIEELRGQLGDLNSELDQKTSELENQVTELQTGSTDMQNTLAELERHNMELQSALDSARNMTYIALGVALIVVISGAVIMYQNRNRS